jgi:rare lipoprotein A
VQRNLRILAFAVVASLLWTAQTSAAPHVATGQKTKKSMKVRYIGTASWYGKKHQGRKMANGKRFDCHQLTAASWYFPLGTPIRVVNLNNGKSVIVTITDRGPNFRLHRILDLSEAAAFNLDYVGDGLTQVFLSPLVSIQTGPAQFDSQLLQPGSADYPVETETATLKTTL